MTGRGLIVITTAKTRQQTRSRTTEVVRMTPDSGDYGSPACDSGHSPARQLAIGAILFNLDGTLVDSTAVVGTLWGEWAARPELNVRDILAISHGRRAEATMRLVAPHLPSLTAVSHRTQGPLGQKRGAPRFAEYF